MQTEIKFLLELVLNHKLPPTAKKLCLERIGEVESGLLSGIRQHIAPIQPMKSAAQIKFESESAPQPTQVEVIAAAPAPAAVKRIVGGEITTGNGTRGPRKF